MKKNLVGRPICRICLKKRKKNNLLQECTSSSVHTHVLFVTANKYASLKSGLIYVYTVRAELRTKRNAGARARMIR